MSYTLIIIDMQPEFECSSDYGLQETIKELIEEAKDHNNPIVIVEYRKSGQTVPEIFDYVDSYHDCYVVRKSCDDGSNEIDKVVQNYELPRNCKVCGINFGYCVKDTVKGLLSKGYNVEVVEEACSQPEDYGNWSDVKSWMKTNGVLI